MSAVKSVEKLPKNRIIDEKGVMPKLVRFTDLVILFCSSLWYERNGKALSTEDLKENLLHRVIIRSKEDVSKLSTNYLMQSFRDLTIISGKIQKLSLLVIERLVYCNKQSKGSRNNRLPKCCREALNKIGHKVFGMNVHFGHLAALANHANNDVTGKNTNIPENMILQYDSCDFWTTLEEWTRERIIKREFYEVLIVTAPIFNEDPYCLKCECGNKFYLPKNLIKLLKFESNDADQTTSVYCAFDVPNGPTKSREDSKSKWQIGTKFIASSMVLSDISPGLHISPDYIVKPKHTILKYSIPENFSSVVKSSLELLFGNDITIFFSTDINEVGSGCKGNFYLTKTSINLFDQEFEVLVKDGIITETLPHNSYLSSVKSEKHM